MRIFLLSTLSLLLFNACTLIPKYEQPDSPVPSNLPKYSAETQSTEGKSEPVSLPWREFIQDGKLQQILEIALENNRDLKIAAANVEQMRALYGIQQGELYPAFYAGGGGGKAKSSKDFLMPGQARRGKQFQADLSLLSWEIDFFGKIRSLSEKALQEFFATEQAKRGVQIMLLSSVAGAYLNLAADRESLKLSEDTYESQKESFELVERQYKEGLATELDLQRAKIPCESARADIARFKRQLAISENALRFLLGSEIPEDLLAADLSEVLESADFASELSSEVLLQRPDILAAEHQLLAAYANIGAARAAFFPNISLTGALGYASTDLSNLFKSGRSTWSFAPQIAMPIFDKRVWAAHRFTKAQRETVLLQYERAIQNAFRETADALASVVTIAEQTEAQGALVEALLKTYELAKFRYEKGIDNYLSVLDAQRSLFAAQQGLISLKLAERVSKLQLYAALGGGALPENTEE